MTDEGHKDRARHEAMRKHAQRLKEVLNPKVLPPSIERLQGKVHDTFHGDKAQRGVKESEATATTAPNLSAATASNTERKKTPKRQRQVGDLLNEHDVAAKLSKSVQTIRRWRMLDKGPKFFKLGGNVRYKPEDVAAWLNEQPSGGEQPKKGK
jgi:predicted DNA-binding transcriptional regulator AlpA